MKDTLTFSTTSGLPGYETFNHHSMKNKR